METSAQVLAHSRCHTSGREVLTFLLTYPRFIHSEIMTHRVFSRNSASSRAIPVSKMLSNIWHHPVVPLRFGRAKRGMQDGGALPPGTAKLAKSLWLLARYPVMLFAWVLVKLKVHKQFANRLLEPWAWMTVVLTGTEWENFYRLRFHKDAQPEFKDLAEKMLAAHAASNPKLLDVGDWHLPFGQDFAGDADIDTALSRCTARCARTSYVNFYGKDSVEDDLRLHQDLRDSGHWSPFEHCCRNEGDHLFHGNFRGYTPYRKLFARESGDSGRPFSAAVAQELLKELSK